jgi:hypothetical protein
MQSGPSLSPSSSWSSKLPPSSTETGMKPLVAEKTMCAEADLEKGITLEVEQVPESINGFR